MAGKIREIMETIIQERSLDNPAIAEMTKAKFILKGIRLENFDQNSEDDPVVIEKLLQLKSQLIEPAPVPKSENIRTAYSTVPIEQEAVRDLKKQLQGFDTKVLFFFCVACIRFGTNQFSAQSNLSREHAFRLLDCGRDHHGTHVEPVHRSNGLQFQPGFRCQN